MTRLLGVFALAIALVAGSGVASYAASVTWRDDTGDVYSLSLADESTPSPAPGEAESDITSVTIRHGAAAVMVTVRLRSLPPRFDTVGLKIKTSSSGPAYLATASAGPGMKIWQLSKGGVGKPIQCRGYHVGFKVAADVIQARIPRACLGNPRWVRVGAMVSTAPDLLSLLFSAGDDEELSAEDEIGYVDVAGIGAIPDSMWRASGSPLPLGPKVRRG